VSNFNRRPSRAKVAAKRAEWMSAYSAALLLLVPGARIDWATASYLESVGRPAAEAAASSAPQAREYLQARADGTGPYEWGDAARNAERVAAAHALADRREGDAMDSQSRAAERSFLSSMD
jgi:hypothetical protein